MGVKFGTEEGTFGLLLRAKFHPHRCNMSPARRKPSKSASSKLNTGRFALRAMLPVITLTTCSILFLRTAKPGNNAIAFARWRTRVGWTSVSGNSTAINVFSCDHLTQVLWAYSFHRLLQAIIATYSNDNIFIMAALCNRAGHYIFAL